MTTFFMNPCLSLTQKIDMDHKKYFILRTPYTPAGDQQQAIDSLISGIKYNDHAQTLLGITGSGKTYTIAAVIEKIQRPVLVMSHNKILAAQLYREFKDFFPDNLVEFFISYYDYYQPESYILSQNKYIEKDMSINSEIQRLRLKTTSALLSGRKDIIVVASVSCIYGIGSPSEYTKLILHIKEGDKWQRDDFTAKIVGIHYSRTEKSLEYGMFRIRGDIIDIFPIESDRPIRIYFWDDEIEAIYFINSEDGTKQERIAMYTLFPGSHFVTTPARLQTTCELIKQELQWRKKILLREDRIQEARRIEERTLLDIDMLNQVGYCSGIENYSRYLSARKPKERPYCLFDYFPDNFLLVVDESHQTIPQIQSMYAGDRSRKLTLIEHGFRLPSALDNRPLAFQEWETLIPNVIFVSATPSEYEIEQSGGIIVEQIIRPTGLLEPEIEIRPLKNQLDDIIDETRKAISQDQRVLIITITKRLSEEISLYLKDLNISSAYLHSDLDALERIEVIYRFRQGDINALVGINLLREGLDIPEIGLIVIMDADKEGFLRSSTALFQIIGRAARNKKGRAILYADTITKSISKVLKEIKRRRKIQIDYNRKNHIVPYTVKKEIKRMIEPYLLSNKEFLNKETRAKQLFEIKKLNNKFHFISFPNAKPLIFNSSEELVGHLKKCMHKTAKKLDFELASQLRDQIKLMENSL